MAHARAWLVLALVLAAALTGCLQDLEREPLDTGWSAQGTLVDAPTLRVEGWPGQLLVTGSVSVTPGQPLELTGLSATLTANETALELTPARLRIAERVVQPGQVEETTLTVENGDELAVSFLPAPGAPTSLPAGGQANVTVEVQWRFRQGASFDAGRLTFEANLTIASGDGIGTGAAELADGRVQRLVFPDPTARLNPGTIRLEVFEVSDQGKERRGPVEATVSRGEGVALADMVGDVGVPEGNGYLLFAAEAGEGQPVVVATAPFQGGGERTPGPGVLIVAGLLASSALLLRAGRSNAR